MALTKLFSTSIILSTTKLHFSYFIHMFTCRSRPCTGTSKSGPEDLQGTSTVLEDGEEEFSSSEEDEGLSDTQSSLSKLSSARGISPQPEHHSD